MNVPNLEALIGESEQDHARVLAEEAQERHKKRAEESLERYKRRARPRDLLENDSSWLDRAALERAKKQAKEEIGCYWTGRPSDYYRRYDYSVATPVTTTPLNPKRLPGS